MPHCQTCIDTLRRLGYRITPQREMIVETLAHSQGHMTPDEIYGQVHTRAKAVNLATVYRTLDLLVQSGLATQVRQHDGQVVYSTIQHGPHLHLVCRNCGETIKADQQLIEPLAAELRAQYRFSADLHHITIYGTCGACQS